jgi:metal-responsive CopG/Arc/MetJ family transcriptional regulator
MPFEKGNKLAKKDETLSLVQFRVSADQLAAIDEAAKLFGIKRSEVIRELISAGLEYRAQEIAKQRKKKG